MTNDKDGDDHILCSICLDPMAESDIRHPLMCPSQHCHFNFCVTCIESLMQSSRDAYAEASDGSQQVKVYLHCPNCRSDLKETIRDTVLLRKVDALIGKPECELTDRQNRLKQAIATDSKLQRAVADARQHEVKFFEAFFESSESLEEKKDIDYEVEDVSYEEVGVEVDELGTPDQYMKVPDYLSTSPVKTDTTLLAGLEEAMAEEDQQHITELMTSGDTSKLAEAAKILAEIAKFVHRGIQKPSMMKRSSIYNLLERPNRLHPSAFLNGARALSKLPSKGRITQRQRKEVERMIRRKSAYMKLHPLPVRMPKYVELNLVSLESLPFTLCDDVWDGTVMDAFSKITVWRDNKVSKKKQTNPGIRNILDGGTKNPNCGEVRIDLERRRSLVASIAPEGGRMGIMRGDVITHLNGEELSGLTADGLKEKLVQILHVSKTEDPKKLCFVFNAERSTAAALKLRAIARD